MTSVWLDELGEEGLEICDTLPSYADTVIVGAGMSGAALAWYLTQAGRSCLVIEARGVAGGASGRNGGIMWAAPEDEFEVRGAEKVYEFVNTIEAGKEMCMLDQKGGVSIVEGKKKSEFEDTFNASDESDDEVLLDYLEEIDPCKFLGAAPGFFKTAYYDKSPATFYPARVVRSLLQQSQPLLTFVPNCVVETIQPVPVATVTRHSGRRQMLRTSLGFISCRDVIVATNAWLPELLPELAQYLKAVSNTVICPNESLPESLRWKCSGVSCGHGAAEVYMNIRADGRLVIGGLRERSERIVSADAKAEEDAVEEGEIDRNSVHSSPAVGTSESDSDDDDSLAEGRRVLQYLRGAEVSQVKKVETLIGGTHGRSGAIPKGDEEADPDIVAALIAWFGERFPELSRWLDWERAPTWKGLISISKDGMPLCGAIPGLERLGVFVIGGYSGHGMPRCMGLACSLAATLLGQPDSESDYRARCDPARHYELAARKPVMPKGNFIKMHELLNAK
jgi:glycine/D-amino acid oxidase-like deaminating enzyme